MCTRSAVSGSADTAAAIRAAVSGSAPYSRKYPASSSSSAAGNRLSIRASSSTSAPTSSFWLVTEMYSPVPIENAPATSEAAPVSTTVCADTPPPPSPEISDAFVTSPSTAPKTVGRSQPPETSRCRCDQPARSAADPRAHGAAACHPVPTRQSPPRSLPVTDPAIRPVNS